MNVLKPFKKTTVLTLIENGISQHKIFRKTGIDRKTIRKYQGILAPPQVVESNSPMATGFYRRSVKSTVTAGERSPLFGGLRSPLG